MFKYTKLLLADIRFWCREMKIRSKENAEWKRIETEVFEGFEGTERLCRPPRKP